MVTAVIAEKPFWISDNTVIRLLDAGRLLTVDLKPPLPDVRDIELSPQGKKLLFITETQHGDEFHYGLYGYDLTTLNLLTLTEWSWRHTFGPNDISLFYTPAWSPDEQSIIFFDRITWDYYVIDLLSGERQYVAHLTTPEGTVTETTTPCWSPDGRQIAVNLGRGRLLVVNRDGSDLREFYDVGAHDLCTAWSPDSQRILLDRGSSIRIMDAQTGEILVQWNDAVRGWWCSDRWLAGLVRVGSLRQPQIMNLDTGDVTVLEGDILSQDVRSITWSPDCTRLAFQTGEALYITDLSGRVLHTVITANRAPAWLDNNTLFFLAGNRSNRPVIIRFAGITNHSVDATTFGILEHNPNETYGVLWSAGGTRLFYSYGIHNYNRLAMLNTNTRRRDVFTPERRFVMAYAYWRG